MHIVNTLDLFTCVPGIFAIHLTRGDFFSDDSHLFPKRSTAGKESYTLIILLDFFAPVPGISVIHLSMGEFFDDSHFFPKRSTAAT